MEIESGKKATARVAFMGNLKYSRVGNTHIIFRKDKILATVGPHWPGVIFTGVLIIFAAYLNIYIIQVNQTVFQSSFIALVCVLCVLAELSLYSCALRDPGIILPQSSQGDINEENRSLFTENGKYHYCDICEINQPVGAAHCSFCDICIEKLDHHCPWMGKCVGKKNMFWFQILIGVVVVYMIELITVGLVLR